MFSVSAKVVLALNRVSEIISDLIKSLTGHGNTYNRNLGYLSLQYDFEQILGHIA